MVEIKDVLTTVGMFLPGKGSQTSDLEEVTMCFHTLPEGIQIHPSPLHISAISFKSCLR